MKLVLPGDSERVPELGDVVIVQGVTSGGLRAALVAEEPESDSPGRHRLDLYVLAIPPTIAHRIPPATELDGHGWFWRDGSDVIEVIRQEGAETRQVIVQEGEKARAAIGGGG